MIYGIRNPKKDGIIAASNFKPRHKAWAVNLSEDKVLKVLVFVSDLASKPPVHIQFPSEIEGIPWRHGILTFISDRVETFNPEEPKEQAVIYLKIGFVKEAFSLALEFLKEIPRKRLLSQAMLHQNKDKVLFAYPDGAWFLTTKLKREA